MPLSDNYETERDLKRECTAIAEAITKHIKAIDKGDRWEFVLFLVDRRTGTLHFISDMPNEDSNVMLQAHIKRSLT